MKISAILLVLLSALSPVILPAVANDAGIDGKHDNHFGFTINSQHDLARTKAQTITDAIETKGLPIENNNNNNKEGNKNLQGGHIPAAHPHPSTNDASDGSCNDDDDDNDAGCCCCIYSDVIFWIAASLIIGVWSLYAIVTPRPLNPDEPWIINGEDYFRDLLRRCFIVNTATAIIILVAIYLHNNLGEVFPIGVGCNANMEAMSKAHGCFGKNTIFPIACDCKKPSSRVPVVHMGCSDLGFDVGYKLFPGQFSVDTPIHNLEIATASSSDPIMIDGTIAVKWQHQTFGFWMEMPYTYKSLHLTSSAPALALVKSLNHVAFYPVPAGTKLTSLAPGDKSAIQTVELCFHLPPSGTMRMDQDGDTSVGGEMK